MQEPGNHWCHSLKVVTQYDLLNLPKQESNQAWLPQILLHDTIGAKKVKKKIKLSFIFKYNQISIANDVFMQAYSILIYFSYRLDSVVCSPLSREISRLFILRILRVDKSSMWASKTRDGTRGNGWVFAHFQSSRRNTGDDFFLSLTLRGF